MKLKKEQSLMNSFVTTLREMRGFLILWLTQALSSLGSSMTAFALVVWSYQAEGSALTTALLSVCSYAPYVLMSILAGALSDRWNKKATLLVCDTFAALTTVAVLVLLRMGRLEIWHLYTINAVNGLMNTVQQPASDVTVSLLTPRAHYQKAGSLRALSGSLVSILTPAMAAALFSLFGLETVLLFDLATFLTAALALLFLIEIPEAPREGEKAAGVWRAAGEGLAYLKKNRGVMDLVLFLAGINLVASMHQAALPALALSFSDQTGYGILNTATGLATLAGSLAATLLPAPKNRVRVVCNALLFAMCTENFFLAFGRSVPVWCVGAVLGWFFIPTMNTNLDVLLRGAIPLHMQGRVYAARNALQFFTIPVGYFLGGALVDRVLEPFMARQGDPLLAALFGVGKGAGAGVLFFLLGLMGVAVCLLFRRDAHIRRLR
jgi:MFS family permease